MQFLQFAQLSIKIGALFDIYVFVSLQPNRCWFSAVKVSAS
jgi:hypothetical protein